MGQAQPVELELREDWTTSRSQEAASDVWLVPVPRREHLTTVNTEARSLIGALLVNVEFVRSSLGAEVAARGLSAGFRDIEACCERLTALVEDAVLGQRDEGMRVTPKGVPFGSLVAAAVRRVRKRASAQQVGISLDPPAAAEIDAMLDGPLLTYAIDRFLDHVVMSATPGEHIAVSYRLEGNELSLTVRGVGRTSLRPSLSPIPLSRRPLPNNEIPAALEHAQAVIRAHGGRTEIAPGRAGAPTVSIRIPRMASSRASSARLMQEP